MISNAFMIYAGVALLSVVAGIFVFRYIRWRIQPLPERDEDETGFDLADPVVRHRLQRMLAKYGIVGNADIREGQVYEPVSLDRMHPLLGVVNSATMVLQRLKNPAASSLYIRDSVNDRFMIVPELDLEDLREIAELLRAAVAERAARIQNHGN